MAVATLAQVLTDAGAAVDLSGIALVVQASNGNLGFGGWIAAASECNVGSTRGA